MIGFGMHEGEMAAVLDNEVLAAVEPEDLLKFGMIPEFVGRFSCLATLSELDEDALLRILVEPKNAVCKQFQKLMELEGVKLEFTQEALEELAAQALLRKTGARGLRAILEKVMLDVMYDIPARPGVSKCVMTREVITQQSEPLLVYEDQVGTAS